MKSIIHLVTAHPYALLLFSGLLERVGFPLFFAPVLVASGALAAAGQMHFDLAVWIALLTCIAGDALWYEMGRKKGDSVLSILCRISLEPETCIRRSKNFFGKSVPRTLLLSKWLPGLSHVIPSVAGLSGVSRKNFFLLNTAGSAAWIFVLMLAGYLPVEHVHVASAIAPIVLEASVVLLLGNIGVKYVRRRRFVNDLYKARITPEELNTALKSAQKIVVLDLRHPLDSVTDQRTVPGALRVLPDDVTSHADLLPKDRDIVLYCT